MWPGSLQLRSSSAALLAVGLVLATAGCAGLEGSGERSDRPQSQPGDAQPVPDRTPSRPLPAAWYEDPDGDFIPTAAEQRMGDDPVVDDCVKEINCPNVDPATGAPASERPQNTLLMLDSSGSMAGRAGGGKKKIDVAKGALERYVTGTPDSVELGFVVYGHTGSNRPEDKAKSCRGPEVLAPLGRLDYRSVPKVLDRFEPRGFTPVAGALREARSAFQGEEDADNRIVLVSDGVETCGGDPVAAARALKRAGVRVTVDVVGFDIGKEADRDRLRRVAEVTGGEYSDARSGADLDAYFDRERERFGKLLDASLCVLSKSVDANLCELRRANDASSMAFNDAISERRRADDEVAADALQERENATRDAIKASRDRRRNRSSEIRDRLREERSEIQERLSERYGAAATPFDRSLASVCTRPLLRPVAAVSLTEAARS